MVFPCLLFIRYLGCHLYGLKPFLLLHYGLLLDKGYGVDMIIFINTWLSHSEVWNSEVRCAFVRLRCTKLWKQRSALIDYLFLSCCILFVFGTYSNVAWNLTALDYVNSTFDMLDFECQAFDSCKYLWVSMQMRVTFSQRYQDFQWPATRWFSR
jgi:hypothetical protein